MPYSNPHAVVVAKLSDKDSKKRKESQLKGGSCHNKSKTKVGVETLSFAADSLSQTNDWKNEMVVIVRRQILCLDQKTICAVDSWQRLRRSKGKIYLFMGGKWKQCLFI
jgi:hypothetical protein